MRTILMISVAGALLFAACGSDDDPTESAISAVCDAQDQVIEDVAALTTADRAETTGEDLNEMLESLQSSVDQLQEARGDLVSQDVDNVKSAFDSLKSSLGELGDVPLTELEDAAVAAVDEEIYAFTEAYVVAYSNSSCEAEASQ
jgi:predicted nuclease with TOPRIM domain